MLFTWFMLAGFILLFSPQSLTNKFQFAFARIFRWPLSIGRNISLSAHTQPPLTGTVSRREFNQLQNHLANLEEQLLQERQKFENLAGLYNRYTWQGAEFVLADVITTSLGGSKNELLINCGEKQGLARGQFVLGNNSIIGTISEVDSRTARVKLVTDTTSQIEVEIEGLKIGRLMRGFGGNLAKVQLVQIEHRVRIGNKVFARKKPGLLDAPIITGTVTRCKKDDENPMLWDITVEPACEIEGLNNVAVIIMNPS